ncbi:MAG: ferredoxin [Herbaspirillum sp.]|jgi:ferredoxin|nr:ferredoxin [Herbaspirillum sp.]
MPHSADSAAPSPRASQPASSFIVRIEPHGWLFAVDGAATLLEAARHAGVILSSSCRNGACRACLSRLQDGEIAYSVEWPGVSADEKKQGWFLPCVAMARSDLIIFAPSAQRPA